MAYYKPINLVKGDDLPLLQITLRDSNEAATGQVLSLTNPLTWKPIDLTDITHVRLKYRKIGTAVPLITILGTRQTPFANGVVTIAWGLTDLDGTSGDYEGEIELTYTGGKVLTISDMFKFIVRDQF